MPREYRRRAQRSEIYVRGQTSNGLVGGRRRKASAKITAIALPSNPNLPFFLLARVEARTCAVSSGDGGVDKIEREKRALIPSRETSRHGRSFIGPAFRRCPHEAPGSCTWAADLRRENKDVSVISPFNQALRRPSAVLYFSYRRLRPLGVQASNAGQLWIHPHLTRY